MKGGALRGCTIVSPHAGEMIAEAVYAMTHGGSAVDLSAIDPSVSDPG